MMPDWRLHPGSGPYLVLLHGFLCSRTQWQPNLDALGAVCRPITVELLGHHLSYAPDDAEPYHPENYVSALERIRETLGVDRWFLFGASLGGGLTGNLQRGALAPTRVPGTS